MLLNTCKKLNWPKHRQKTIKKEKEERLRKIAAKKHIKSFFLFRQKIFTDFTYVSEYFNPRMYIKKDMPNDVIEGMEENSEKMFRFKTIKLLKSVLKKMKINVAYKRLIEIRSFYEIKDSRFKSIVKKVFENPRETNEICLTLEDIYTPQNESLFFNIDEAKEKLRVLSENEDVRKIHIFLFSFSLFFLEHLHNYLLDLLENKKSVKIQMYSFYIILYDFFEMFYTPLEITNSDFAAKTKIIADEEIISIDDKITEIIQQFQHYVDEVTNKEFIISTSSDEWFVLYSLGINVFIIYTLVYLHYILDLEKLFDDFNYPQALRLEVGLSNGIVVGSETSLGLQVGAHIPENSLLKNIIIEKVNKELSDHIKYFFCTESNQITIIEKAISYKTAAFDFPQQRKVKGDSISEFLLFEKHEDRGICRIFIPNTIESISLFYKLISNNGDKSIDLIYKLAHNTLYKKNKDK